jgi:hypothetical protein
MKVSDHQTSPVLFKDFDGPSLLFYLVESRLWMQQGIFKQDVRTVLGSNHYNKALFVRNAGIYGEDQQVEAYLHC